MLLRSDQLKHLKPDGDKSYRFVDSKDVTKKERRELKEMDDAAVELFGYHLITNIEDLLKYDGN